MRHAQDANILLEIPRDELRTVVGNDPRSRLRVFLLGGLQNDLDLGSIRHVQHTRARVIAEFPAEETFLDA